MNRTFSDYIDWAVDQTRRMNESAIQVEGDADGENAKSLVRAMLELELAEKLAALGLRQLLQLPPSFTERISAAIVLGA